MKGVLAVLASILIAAPAARAADPMAPAGGARASAGPMRYLYLVRHGIYEPDDKVDEFRGNGLNALGHAQAKRVGERLAALPVHVTSLVCSDMARARQTAEDMGAVMGMAPVSDSLLRECTPPSDRPDIARDLDPAEAERCTARLEAAWARYARPATDADARDVLVCHGNVIRWFVTRALVQDAKRWGNMEIGNASITVIAVRPDGTTRLVVYSDVGHLPVAEQTWSGRGAGWAAAARR